MEHKDTKICGETPGTNASNGQVQLNILGLCEMRWKNFAETTTEEGRKVFFSGKKKRINTSMTLDFLFTRTV